MADDATNSHTAKIEAIKVIYELWLNENNVKTQKLTLFFTAQSILVAAYAIVPTKQYLVPVVGMVFSFIWFFSTGRTVSFQKAWKEKINALLSNAPDSIRQEFDFYPTSEDKKKMPFYGRMPATYIVLWPPAAGFLLWLGILVYTFM